MESAVAALVTIVAVSYVRDGERLDVTAVRERAAEDMAAIRRYPADDWIG